MPKRKKPRRSSAPKTSRPLRPAGGPDPFADLAGRVERIAAWADVRNALLEGMDRRKEDYARIDEAEALLRAAVGALRDDRELEAQDRVRAAVGLAPVDQGEVSCAGMAVSNMIGNEIERQAVTATDERDTRWLDRALALVRRPAGPATRDLRLAVATVTDFQLSPDERARVDAVLFEADRFGGPLETIHDTDLQVEVVLTMLRALMELQDSAASPGS